MRKLRQKNDECKVEEPTDELHALDAAPGQEILGHIGECRDTVAEVYMERRRDRPSSAPTPTPTDTPIAELNAEISAEYGAAEERGIAFLGAVTNILGYLYMACDGDVAARDTIMRWAKTTQLPDARTIASGPRKNVLPPFVVHATDADVARSLKTKLEVMRTKGITGAYRTAYLAGGGSPSIWPGVDDEEATRGDAAKWLAQELAHHFSIAKDSHSVLEEGIARAMPRGTFRDDPNGAFISESFDEDAEKTVRAAFRVAYVAAGRTDAQARKLADGLFHAERTRRRRRGRTKGR